MAFDFDWTFTPKLNRLADAGTELSTGTVTVGKTDTVRVGVYVEVSTSVEPTPSILGYRSGSLIITLGGTGLTTTALLSLLDINTVSFTQNPSLLLQPTAIVIAGPREPPTGYDIAVIDVGFANPRGVRCEVQAGNSSCEIFLGTLAIPLSPLMDADYGALTLTMAWTPDARLEDHNGDTGVMASGSSVAYRINPALPFLSGPAINGSTLTLTASESLDSTTTPANDAFTVTFNGDDNAVTNIGISGTTVTLTLTDAVIQSDAVTVAYSAPATDFLTTGTEAVLSLAETDVTNNTPASTDATLSGISLDNVAVKGFDRTGDLLVYTAGVASSVSQPVLRATPNNAGAIVNILADDGTTVLHTADRGEPTDYRVPTLSANQPRWLKVQVEPEDASGATIVYDLVIGRGSTLNSEWKVVDDFESGSLSGIATLAGVWSDGTTVWVADLSDDGDATTAPAVLAYSLDGTRDDTKDITLPSAITTPYGIWGDSDTIFVANSGTTVATRGLYAFKRSDRTRDSSKDLGVGESAAEDTIHETVTDLWSDGQTLWTAAGTDGVQAWSLPDFASDEDETFATDLARATGIWSDGERLWVAGVQEVAGEDVAKILAYDLSTKSSFTPPPPPPPRI